MQDNNIHVRLSSRLVLILLVIAFLSGSCAEYGKYIQTEGARKFSLDYPKKYEAIKTDIYPNFTDVFIGNPSDQTVEDVLSDIGDSSISIHISNAIASGYIDSRSVLDRDMLTRSKFFDYQLLERSSINIDGVKGEQWRYSVPISHRAVLEGKEAPRGLPYFTNIVYFDFRGDIWIISMTSVGKEIAEANESVWKHILETFTILD